MKRCLRCDETLPKSMEYCPTDGARLVQFDNDALIGLVLDKTYEIAGRIGKGGMGAVYVARHKKLPKLFAIKVIRPELATDEELIYRFERELRLLASLDHPNIVPITDGGLNESKTPHERIFYMVMKHIEGKSLGEILDLEKRLPVERAVHLGGQICAGIAAAHQAGIIHLDLKPDNVMIEKIDEQENVRVVDFGIAISKDDDQRLTEFGIVVGTPSYLSPERVQGADADYTSDTYALGLIFYEMLSGQHPFTATTPKEMASKHLYETPRPLHELCPAIPAPLARVVMKALEKDPKSRQQSVKELANDLAAALKVEPARVLTPDEVFIAYSNDDANEVFEVVQPLRNAGLSVWLDRGSDAAEISRAIRECKVVMVMCSDAGLRSRKVKQEMLAAWQHDKFYLPVLLKPTSFQSYFTDWLSGNSCVEVAGNAPQHWMPY
jgi:serine/threonine protein kinase